MKHSFTIYLFCFLLISLSACRKDSYSEDKDTIISPPSVYYLISVSGVINNSNNVPLQGAEVFIGDLRAVTDKNGAYLFRSIRVAEEVTTMKINANGHESHTHLFLPEKGKWFRHDFKLNQKSHTASFNNADGISLELEQQARLEIPANAVQLFSGAPYNGEIRILAELLDPNNLEDMTRSPGLFLTGNGLENKKSILSHGILHVRMETPGGVKLKLKPEYSATFKAPVLQALLQQSDLGASIWYLNESTGNWEAGPSIQRNGSFFETTLSELSWITYGKSIDCTWLSGNLHSFKNVPFNQSPLEIKVGEFYQNSITPCADGRFRFLVPMHNSVKLSLKSNCSANVFSRDFNSVVTSTELGTIKMTPGSGLATISGSFIFCENKSANAYLLIQSGNGTRVLFPNAQNVFSGIFDQCASSAELKMTIVNVNEGIASKVVSLPGNKLYYDFGQLELCDANNMIPSYAFLAIGTETYFSTITDASLSKIKLSIYENELVVSSALKNRELDFELIMFDLKDGFSLNPKSGFKISGAGVQYMACNLPSPDCNVELIISDYNGPGSSVRGSFSGASSLGFEFDGGFDIRVVEKR